MRAKYLVTAGVSNTSAEEQPCNNRKEAIRIANEWHAMGKANVGVFQLLAVSSHQKEYQPLPLMGRPSQGREKRIQVQVTSEVYSWVEQQKKESSESMSDVVFRLLKGLAGEN